MNKVPIHITAFYEHLSAQARTLRAQDNLLVLADALESPAKTHGKDVAAMVMGEDDYQTTVAETAFQLRDIDRQFKDLADAMDNAVVQGLTVAKAFFGDVNAKT